MPIGPCASLGTLLFTSYHFLMNQILTSLADIAKAQHLNLVGEFMRENVKVCAQTLLLRPL